MSTPSLAAPFLAHVRKEGGRLMWVGGALLVIGIAALVFPSIATMVATLYVGWILIFSGAATLFGAFSMRGAGPFFGALLLGLLSVAAGVFILARPKVGELAITLSLGALFMVQGAFELFLAFELRPARSWGWVLVSALASIVLSVLILTGLPGTSMFTLGVLIGVNFITSGIAYLMLGGAARREIPA
jgi:uncharacterized membrane protein HdeD (DUF308 family)